MIQPVGEKIVYQENDLVVGVSIGIAIYPDHGDDPVSLQKAADDAMYRVTRSGKNNYMFALE